MELDLKFKSALVTGASRGIGRAIAVALAREKMCVTVTARDTGGLQETVDQVMAAGAPGATMRPADLTTVQAVDDIIDATLDGAGRIDLLVNCAGATKRGDFFSLSDQDWQDGYALKLHGAVRLCRAAWPHLVKSGGSIVNIIGIGAHTPSADFTIGGSVNAAFAHFTKSLADIGGRDGVRVNGIHPGSIMTDRLERRIDAAMETSGSGRERVVSDMLAKAGISRFGQPQEIGELVAFLASGRASYIHGALIDVDGGATRGL